MRRQVFSLGLGLALLVLLLPRPAAAQANQYIELPDMVKGIKQALQLAANDAAEHGGGVEIKEVYIELAATASKGVDGKFSFLFFTIGGKYKKENSHKLQMTLTPPKPRPVAEAVFPAQALAEAIIKAQEAIRVAGPELVLKGMTLEMKFAVVKGVQGGLALTIIPLEANGNYEKENVQLIRLTF